MKSFHFSTSSSEIGPLEERVLSIFWKLGNATSRELVSDELSDLAYTTVSTTLDRMFKKGLLRRKRENRTYRYSVLLTQQELLQQAAADAIRRSLQAGSSSLPLSYFVEIISERDSHLLDDLFRAIEEKRSELTQSRP